MHSMNAIADQETYHSVDSTSATAETSAEQSEDELHDIMEAFYGAVSEEELKTYQNQRKPASSAAEAEAAAASTRPMIQNGDIFPEFDLVDQDNDEVALTELLQPVRWCWFFIAGNGPRTA